MLKDHLTSYYSSTRCLINLFSIRMQLIVMYLYRLVLNVQPLHIQIVCAYLIENNVYCTHTLPHIHIVTARHPFRLTALNWRFTIFHVCQQINIKNYRQILVFPPNIQKKFSRYLYPSNRKSSPTKKVKLLPHIDRGEQSKSRQCKIHKIMRLL